MSKAMKFKVAKCDLKETELVKQQILVVRGHRVMLDADLATLYGVTTKRLNQQFRRNHHRFPDDFAFQLTLAEAKEVAALRLQNDNLKEGAAIPIPDQFTALVMKRKLMRVVADHLSRTDSNGFIKNAQHVLDLAACDNQRWHESQRTRTRRIDREHSDEATHRLIVKGGTDINYLRRLRD